MNDNIRQDSPSNKGPKQPYLPNTGRSSKNAFGSKELPETLMSKESAANILAAYMNKMDFGMQVPYWIPQSSDVVLKAIATADKGDPRVRVVLTEMVEVGKIVGLYPEVIEAARIALAENK